MNDLIFVNISIEYLLAARLGFPFPHKLEDVEAGTLVSDFDAFYRTKTPLIRFNFHPALITVYQAILIKPEEIAGEERDDYAALQGNSFVRDRLLRAAIAVHFIHTSDGVTTVAANPTH